LAPLNPQAAYVAAVGNLGMQFGSGGAPSALRPGDWMCPSCGFHNFAKNVNCNRCSMLRPDAGSEACTAVIALETQKAQPRVGDWLCPLCQTNNFSSRNTCFKCMGIKPGHMPVSMGLAGSLGMTKSELPNLN